MQGNQDSIGFNSFNCRGLREIKKRKSIFNWLASKYEGISLLQETHSSIDDEVTWGKDWGGKILFSHGSTSSRGVAVLIPNKLMSKVNISDVISDENGRILVLNCKIEQNPLLIVNIYAPTKDNQSLQLGFLDKVKQLITNEDNHNILIGGDFNTYLDLVLDKKGGKPEPGSKYRSNLLSLLEELNLVDIWRIRNTSALKYTRRENTRAGLIQSRLDYIFLCIPSIISNLRYLYKTWP